MRTIKTYSNRAPFYNALIRTCQGSFSFFVGSMQVNRCCNKHGAD